MKLFVLLVVTLALLAAFCSAQPVDSSAPGQPDSLVNRRVKRQYIARDRGGDEHGCKETDVWLIRECVSCKKYMDLTGKESCSKSQDAENASTPEYPDELDFP